MKNGKILYGRLPDMGGMSFSSVFRGCEIKPCLITLCVIQDQKKNDIFHENPSGTFIYPVLSSVLIGNGCSSTMSPEIFLNLPPAYENRYS